MAVGLGVDEADVHTNLHGLEISQIIPNHSACIALFMADGRTLVHDERTVARFHSLSWLWFFVMVMDGWVGGLDIGVLAFGSA